MRKGANAGTAEGDQGMRSLLTLEETAQFLRLSRHTLYKMLASGRIPALRAGRQWRFSKEDLQAWLTSNAKKRRRSSDE
jgi:excisionase family DNA binding protein